MTIIKTSKNNTNIQRKQQCKVKLDNTTNLCHLGMMLQIATFAMMLQIGTMRCFWNNCICITIIKTNLHNICMQKCDINVIICKLLGLFVIVRNIYVCIVKKLIGNIPFAFKMQKKFAPRTSLFFLIW